jgi:hypothetical protein
MYIRQLNSSGISVAAGTGGDIYVANASEQKLKIMAVYFVPHATTAAHGTNYATLTLTVGGTSMATARTTAADALTGGTVFEFTLTGTAGTALELSANCANMLKCAVTHSGTGAAINGHLLVKCSEIA